MEWTLRWYVRIRFSLFGRIYSSSEALLLPSSLSSFSNSGSLLDISAGGTSEKEEFESISLAGHGMKSKPFFLTTFISHPYLLCVIKCQLQKVNVIQ